MVSLITEEHKMASLLREEDKMANLLSEEPKMVSLMTEGNKVASRMTEEDNMASIMTEEHKDTLLKNRTKIIENIRMEYILNDLLAKQTLLLRDVQIIQSMIGYQQAEYFLDILIRGPDRAYNTFITVLNDNNQEHIANLLESPSNSNSNSEEEARKLVSDSPDYTLEGVHKYHLYIAHSMGDGLIVDKICQILQTYKIKCYTRRAYLNEASANSIMARIKEGVLCSRKCFVLLTKNYLDDDWHKIEMKEVATKGHCFSPDMVIIGQSGVVDIPKPLMMKLFVQHPLDESNLIDWVKVLAAIILEEPRGTLEVLPRENMGHASAMGYYYGFLRIVLQDFKERLIEQNFEQFPEMKDKTIKKMFIIIPKSCVCPPALTEKGKIEFSTRYVTRLVNRAGNIARDYKSTIYKFFDTVVDVNGQKREETYYFIGEFATPLLTMYEAYNGGMAKTSLDQLYFQREVFCFTLKQILGHPKNSHCNGLFKIIWWCDDVDEDGKVKEPLYNFLQPILREELAIEKRGERDPLAKLLDMDDDMESIAEGNNLKENVAAATEKRTSFELVDIKYGSNPYAYYETLKNPTYDFTHTLRGKCIIINVSKFHKSKQVTANALSERRGADRDAVNMEELFKSLSFEVQLHHDPNLKIFNQILLTTHLMDHSQYDAFVCVIMTHGKLGVVFASDGLPIKVLDICNFFSDLNCPSLIGKPKMFFIEAGQTAQSVRAENPHSPVVSAPPPEPPAPDSNEAPRLGPDSPLPSGQTAALVPGAPDFLMSYSTLPGSISYRDTVAGSLYIQALANNLKQHEEIDRLLKKVTAEVKEKLKEKGELDHTVYQNQVPFHLTTGMTKLLYLASKNSPP